MARKIMALPVGLPAGEGLWGEEAEAASGEALPEAGAQAEGSKKLLL